MMERKRLTLVMDEFNEKGDIVRTSTVSAVEHVDVSWDVFVPYFVQFLEGTGYVGVSERFDKLIGDIYDWRSYHPELMKSLEEEVEEE